MFDVRDETIIHSVQGKTEYECVKQIQEICGKNYSIRGTEKIKIRSGLLGLRTEPGVKLNYVVTRMPNSFSDKSASSYFTGFNQKELNFEDEKRKIVEKSGKQTEVQLANLTDAVKKIQETLDKGVVSSGEAEHPSIKKIEKYLEENEFSFSYIKNILARIRQEFPLDSLDDFNKVEKSVIKWIGESIKVTKLTKDSSPKIIMLVGPTGIGKTTTVAKLAYQLAYGGQGSEKKIETRILTSDGYKIGAEQQIQKFSSMMNIQYDKVETSKDFNEIIDLHKNYTDLFIVDTSGYSQKDSVHIGSMKQMLDSKKYHPEVLLCMSAATKMSDMVDIMQQYESFSYNALIITKLDETNHVGNIISALNEKNKAMAYITDGQRVPNCIEEASVSRMLLELTGFNVDAQFVKEIFG